MAVEDILSVLFGRYTLRLGLGFQSGFLVVRQFQNDCHGTILFKAYVSTLKEICRPVAKFWAARLKKTPLEHKLNFVRA
jgi:hypothetical protein